MIIPEEARICRCASEGWSPYCELHGEKIKKTTKKAGA